MDRRDAKGGFCGEASPSIMSTVLMYFDDLGHYYEYQNLLPPCELTANRLLEMQYHDKGDEKN